MPETTRSAGRSAPSNWRIATSPGSMTPRTAMVALPETASGLDAARLFTDTGKSRVPVFGEHRDDIVGILYAKDLFPLLVNAPIRGRFPSESTFASRCSCPRQKTRRISSKNSGISACRWPSSSMNTAASWGLSPWRTSWRSLSARLTMSTTSQHPPSRYTTSAVHNMRWTRRRRSKTSMIVCICICQQTSTTPPWRDWHSTLCGACPSRARAFARRRRVHRARRHRSFDSPHAARAAAGGEQRAELPRSDLTSRGITRVVPSASRLTGQRCEFSPRMHVATLTPDGPSLADLGMMPLDSLQYGCDGESQSCRA